MLKLINFNNQNSKLPICLGDARDITVESVINAANKKSKAFFYKVVDVKDKLRNKTYNLIKTYKLCEANNKHMFDNEKTYEINVDLSQQECNVENIVDLSKYAPKKLWYVPKYLRDRKIGLRKDRKLKGNYTLSDARLKRYKLKTIYERMLSLPYEERTGFCQKEVVDYFYRNYEKLQQKGIFKENTIYYGNSVALKAMKELYEDQKWEWIQNKNVYLTTDMKYTTEVHIGRLIRDILTITNNMFYKGESTVVDTESYERDDDYYSAGIIDITEYHYNYTPVHMGSDCQYIIVLPYHKELFDAYISINNEGVLKYNKSIKNQFKKIKLGFYKTSKLADITREYVHVFIQGKYVRRIRVDDRIAIRAEKSNEEQRALAKLCGYKLNNIDEMSINYFTRYIETCIDTMLSTERIRELASQLDWMLRYRVNKWLDEQISLGYRNDIEDKVFYEDSYKEDEEE